MNRRASLMEGAGEREIINPKAERSSGCCSCAQGNLRERRGRQRKRLARHGEMLTRLVPTQFLSSGAGSARFSPVSACQAQPAAGPWQALLPALMPAARRRLAGQVEAHLSPRWWGKGCILWASGEKAATEALPW